MCSKTIYIKGKKKVQTEDKINCNSKLKKRKKKKKGKVSHQSTVTATVLAQCKHTECTVPKHYSGHWCFLYIRYIIHKNRGLAILRFSNEYVQSSNLSLLLNNNKIKYKKYKVLLQFIM